MDLKVKLVAEKSSLEEQAKKNAPQMKRTYSRLVTPQCEKGKIDPAFARQETEKEWKLVSAFAQINPDVIRESGGIEAVYPGSSAHKQGEVMAYRYELSVNGMNGKSIYPIIRVTRDNGAVKFTLECISHIDPGKREAFKDECDPVGLKEGLHPW